MCPHAVWPNSLAARRSLRISNIRCIKAHLDIIEPLYSTGWVVKGRHRPRSNSVDEPLWMEHLNASIGSIAPPTNPSSWILKLLQARWLRAGPNSLMPMPPSSTQRAVCPTQYRLGCSFSTILMIQMFSKMLKAMSHMCWQTGRFYTSVDIRILHDLEHPSLLKE